MARGIISKYKAAFDNKKLLSESDIAKVAAH